MTDPNDTVIEALLREREGYVSRGLDGRVAQVDEQLAYRGYVAKQAEAEDASGDEAIQEAEATADDQPEPVEPKRTTVESKPRRRA